MFKVYEISCIYTNNSIILDLFVIRINGADEDGLRLSDFDGLLAAAIDEIRQLI